MPSKPIKQGYKLFGIADHGYIYSWIWSSKIFSIKEVESYDSLTNTSALVRALVVILPCSRITIYLDNYFISIPLFSELRACKFGIVSTTRPHKEFLNQLVEIKNRFVTKLEQNTLLAVVVQNVLCLAQQDNNIVLALSNIHTVNRAEDFREKQRQHPAKTLTNRRIVKKVFGDNSIKELQITYFIDDYNHYIGDIDLANQYQEGYETYRTILRNQWPLFYQLIDIACINTYRLYRLYTEDSRLLTYVQFRIELYSKLFEYSLKAKLHSLRVELGGKRVFGPDLPHLHYWEKRSRSVCVWCAYKLKCQKVLKKVDSKRKANRVHGGCVFCNVNLCKEGDCWAEYHSNTDY